MVNEAFVRRFFNGRSPIGMRLAIRPVSAPTANPLIREIVGVARQVKGRPDETDDFLQIYVPLSQNTVGDIFLLFARSPEMRLRSRLRCVPRSRGWTPINSRA
jgi:hypothetical protein